MTEEITQEIDAEEYLNKFTYALGKLEGVSNTLKSVDNIRPNVLSDQIIEIYKEFSPIHNYIKQIYEYCENILEENIQLTVEKAELIEKLNKIK